MPGPPATPPAPQPLLQRRIPDFFIDAFPLALLLGAMVAFDRWFNYLDAEAIALSRAARPVSTILAGYLSGALPHSRPPLYDLLLHFWLLATRGGADWLRVPAIFFYAAGLWTLSRAARRIGGIESGTALIWLGILWPYGFHFGRVESWYSFAFFVVAGLTWSYLAYCLSPSRGWWITAWVFALVLVYTTYFGWAFVGLVTLDAWLRNRRSPGTASRLAAAAGLLVLAYAPLWPSFARALAGSLHLRQSWTLRGLGAIYSAYVLIVSPAMAPWFWKFGVPAALGVAAALLLALFGLRGETQRLLIFSGVLLVVMTLAGILATARLFLLAPWCLLPMAVALGTIKNYYWRGALVVALVVAAGLGWYGTYFRRFYASPRFLEPWGAIAAEAGAAADRGAVVIANKPALFLYMTYALRVPASPGGWHFQGILPDQVRAPNVYDPQGWQAAGMPTAAGIMWIRGTSPSAAAAKQMDDTGAWLDPHCGERTTRYMVPDAGYDWKQRLLPQSDGDIWAVEIRQYECGPAGAAPPVPSGPGSNPAPQ